MNQITTLEKFDHVSEQVDENIDCIHPDNMDIFNTVFIKWAERGLAIQADYAKDLEIDAADDEVTKESAKRELVAALAEEKESKRIAKIRSRITGTGLSSNDFVAWALDRPVYSGRTIMCGVYTNDWNMLIGYNVGKSQVLDPSKVWRIA